MKSIYTYYKQRLVEISGKNRSLFSRKITKKNRQAKRLIGS